jgi:hypothetical protein
MATIASIKLLPETIRSLAFGAIGAAYMGVGTSLTQPSRVLYLQNLTDQELLFSFDGVNDHLILPQNGFFLIDITANKTNQAMAFFVEEGTRIYVKHNGVAPLSGSAYVSTFYGTQS